jgi:hypothetical protein
MIKFPEPCYLPPLIAAIGEGIASIGAAAGAAASGLGAGGSALAGGALAGAGGLAASLLGQPKAPNISLPGQAPPAQQPTGTASTFKPAQPSFLGAAATPAQSQVGGKSLLGQ